MKRLLLLPCVVVLISAVGATAAQARMWTKQEIRDVKGNQFICGNTPSMALLYGVQPVVSNYYGMNSSNAKVLRKTAFGWTDYPVGIGYIDGDGLNNIQSYSNPLIYGQDGKFYSTTTSNNQPCPITLDGGSGPAWAYGFSNYPSFVSADAKGTVYMAAGNLISQSLGSSWATAVKMPYYTILDLAVSPYGDIAVSIGDSSVTAVSWYDFKNNAWCTRRLGSSGLSQYTKVDVEWDKKGNLGVAYSDLSGSTLKFDYMDSQTSYWTSEVVCSPGCGANLFGTALDYDRFGNPVIASGCYLFYDPAPVPEPSSLLVLGMGALGLLRFKKRS